MLRAIALSLALLIGIGMLIPLATEFAEAGTDKNRKYKKKKVKKYSKRWWKNYNQRKRARQIRAKRKRQARIRRARAAKLRRVRRARAVRQATVRRSRVAKKQRTYSKSRSKAKRRSNKSYVSSENNAPAAALTGGDTSIRSAAAKQPLEKYPSPVILPTGQRAPSTWRSEGVQKGELMFNVSDHGGSPVGSASIAVVGPAANDSQASDNRAKTVGGVAITSLRRTVIDQMIKENGWVVNDYQKEIGGQKVYVVVAQSPGANNQVENRMFYFTEVEGKIYSVATKSPDNGAERLEEESEKVINSLQRRNTPPTQVATNRTVSNLVANEE